MIAFDCQLLLGPVGPFATAAVAHATFADLTPALLQAHTPSLIILPLFAADYDATTAVEALERLGYGGRYAVLAPGLPKPGLVERELRGLGPGPRLTLISP